MPKSLNKLDQTLSDALHKRAQNGSLRSLQDYSKLTDFCSNDYLGLSRSQVLRRSFQKCRASWLALPMGSSGSRLITGNSSLAEETEALVARQHHAEAALVFSSGFAANSGLFAAIARPEDTLITDELVHASIIDGVRLSKARRLIFAHNDLQDLERCLRASVGNIFIGVESVYSMDGDFAPLIEMAKLAETYGAHLIVDEAHSSGIIGPNGAGRVVQLGLENQISIRVHTFGKAYGIHGAAVVGSHLLREFLINFARPFVFSTAPSPDHFLMIQAAYGLPAAEMETRRKHLLALVRYFCQQREKSSWKWLPATNWIQSLCVPGNQAAKVVAERLQQSGLGLKAILAPTVAKGGERIRICLHAHNQQEEIDDLMESLEEIWTKRKDMLSLASTQK
ncbi:MAG: 8-amino-7-oxononanoate synthase [Bacteroidota bacterium]